LDDVWTILTQASGLRPVIKLLRDEHQQSFAQGGESLMTDRSAPDGRHLARTYELLSRASCVVVSHGSTFTLMASLMDLPIVKIANSFPACGVVTETSLEGLVEAVQQALACPTAQQAERQAFNHEFTRYGDPVENMVNAITARTHAPTH